MANCKDKPQFIQTIIFLILMFLILVFAPWILSPNANEFGMLVVAFIFLMITCLSATNAQHSILNLKNLVPFILATVAYILYLIFTGEQDANLSFLEYFEKNIAKMSSSLMTNLGLIFYGISLINYDPNFSMWENFKSWFCDAKGNQV